MISHSRVDADNALDKNEQSFKSVIKLFSKKNTDKEEKEKECKQILKKPIVYSLTEIKDAVDCVKKKIEPAICIIPASNKRTFTLKTKKKKNWFCLESEKSISEITINLIVFLRQNSHNPFMLHSTCNISSLLFHVFVMLLIIIAYFYLYSLQNISKHYFLSPQNRGVRTFSIVKLKTKILKMKSAFPQRTIRQIDQITSSEQRSNKPKKEKLKYIQVNDKKKVSKMWRTTKENITFGNISYAGEKIDLILENWLTSSFIYLGWIKEFNLIIANYAKAFVQLKTIHQASVRSVKFSPSCTRIVSSSCDQMVRIWDVTSGKEIHVLQGHSGWVNDATFSPDESMVASCSEDDSIRLWDVCSAKQIRILDGHSDYVTGCQFSPDGQTLVSCSWDKTIRLWSVKSGQELQTMKGGHINWVNDVQFSPNGQFIVSSSSDKTIIIWDVKSGERIKKIRGHVGSVWSAKYSPDGLSLVSCSADNTIRIWDINSGKEVTKLIGHPDSVKDVMFSSDGQTILSCSVDKTIRWWDIKSRNQIQTLEGHLDTVIGIDFSSDDDIIVSCSRDGTIRLWG
ncbi:WD-40 repeat protein [Reticulomyxa filosa]|uniref:WD-40 repeat protein n=1 Tax=Reticulomyxa filosa TaxID=46433 RepID=X6PDJ0_RETFI|nr:WD-40 repeat protein [Reticulomyxa filosa]|eukprot:ETO36560.1 WD-40 repeat protein [Reticulomyxa filosa]